MQTDIDFVMRGPLYKTQKAWIHPENDKYRSKPKNVLWTSPVDAQTGKAAWDVYLEDHNLTHLYGEERWHIVPHDDCKILTLELGSKEMNKYITYNMHGDRRLDFEAISKDYDAMYAPKEMVNRFNDELLDGWDVATCIFLKPKFTVMNDETYELLKSGKIKPEEKNAPIEYNPEVNLLPHAFVPLKFKQPVDNSMEAAVDELYEMAKQCSKRTRTGRKKAELYRKAAGVLTVFDSISFLPENEKYYQVLTKPEIAEVALKHGMIPNLKFKFNYNDATLQRLDQRTHSFAEMFSDTRTLKVFLQYGFDADTALKEALLRHNDIRDIKLCLSAGANPNSSDENGVTPLMTAFFPQEVEWLLAAGANPTAVDKNGQSVRDYQEKQPIYNFRVINCKMLDIAEQNMYINDKLAKLRKGLDKNKAERKVEHKSFPRWQEKIKADKKANSLG